MWSMSVGMTLVCLNWVGLCMFDLTIADGFLRGSLVLFGTEWKEILQSPNPREWEREYRPCVIPLNSFLPAFNWSVSHFSQTQHRVGKDIDLGWCIDKLDCATSLSIPHLKSWKLIKLLKWIGRCRCIRSFLLKSYHLPPFIRLFFICSSDPLSLTWMSLFLFSSCCFSLMSPPDASACRTATCSSYLSPGSSGTSPAPRSIRALLSSRTRLCPCIFSSSLLSPRQSFRFTLGIQSLLPAK